ncbi:hypothetical protein G9A89_008011 [Geosiphon pyriformis]|nr:hypothetical protein G9A89_008011 [Geosiphon pyriformis]
MSAEFRNWSLVSPEDAAFSTQKTNQRTLTNNIPSATISHNESLAMIFPFELEKPLSHPQKKPITAMYTDVKVDSQFIKLILDSRSADSIITKQLMDQLANRATKIPISEIDDLLIEINGIIMPIKVLMMEATQYQALIGNDWLSKTNALEQLTHTGTSHMWLLQDTNPTTPLIEFEEKKKKPTWEAYQKQKETKLTWDINNNWETNEDQKEKEKRKAKEEESTSTDTYTTYIHLPPQPINYCQPKLICINCGKKLSSMGTCYGDNKEYPTAAKFYCHSYNQPCLICGKTLLDERIWNNISEQKEMCDKLCQYMILISNWVKKRTPIEVAWRRAVRHLDSCLHNNNKIWQMALAKIEGALPEEIREIKNNPPEPIELDWDSEPVINLLELEEFHEHYQRLASTREEQEQWLEQLNTRLCCHCLILSNFEYCNECNLIYNPPSCMIYTIPEEKEPISSCILESESVFDSDSNSDNDDDKNTGSSSIQIGNKNNSDLDSNSNPEIYITLSDLTKEQILKWFSNNEKRIMLKCAHNTDTGFDLRYPGKKTIKLKPHSCTCIDLKVAMEIPATIMVQLTSRSSLAKRGINIRGGIIDAEYVGNIITMLQNDSEKAYIIELNEKIAQVIFLPLVKIAQLVSMENRKKLGITAKGIQEFRSMGRINILVNMMKEKVIDKKEIISTHQSISIPPYDQYMLYIKREVKNQTQLFETEATICESGRIGLTNLYISAKSPKNIKILIYNTTGSVIEIPKGTIIEYLTTEVEDQPPNISDFP